MHKKNSWKKIEKSLSQAGKLFVSSPFARQCSLSGVINGTMSKAYQLEKLSLMFGVSVRTVRRWMNGEDKAHPCAVALLKNLFMGFPQQGRWRGWYMADDYLVSPSGETLSPDMIGRLWLWRNERELQLSRIRELTRENQSLMRMGSDDARKAISNAVKSLSSLIDHPAIRAAG